MPQQNQNLAVCHSLEVLVFMFVIRVPKFQAGECSVVPQLQLLLPPEDHIPVHDIHCQ